MFQGGANPQAHFQFAPGGNDPQADWVCIG